MSASSLTAYRRNILLLVAEEPRIRLHHLLLAGLGRPRPQRLLAQPRRQEDRPQACHAQEQEQGTLFSVVVRFTLTAGNLIIQAEN